MREAIFAEISSRHLSQNSHFFKAVNNGTGLVKDANFDGKQIPTFSVKRRLMLVCSLKVACKGFFRTHDCFIRFIITSSK